MDMKDGAQTTACLQHALDRGPAPAFRPPTGSMLPTQPCSRHTQPLTLQQVSCWTLTEDAILQVMEVSVCGPRYWQHSVSGAAEAGNPLATCYSAGALHVQRRAGVLSYADDPSGIRSLLSKAFRRVSLGGLCRSSLWAPAPHRGRGPVCPLSLAEPGVQVHVPSCTGDNPGICSLLFRASCCVTPSQGGA